jgi:hypothetical protein
VTAFYRACALMDTIGEWHGRWHTDVQRAERQAMRWFHARTDLDLVWIEAIPVGAVQTVGRLWMLDDDTAIIVDDVPLVTDGNGPP